jgi:ATP synthase protein I
MNLVRKSILPALVVAVVCMTIAGVTVGEKGVVGAGVGSVIVFLFFASSPLALGPVTKVSPQLSVFVALIFFFTKIVALVALMVVVLDPEGVGRHVDKGALGATVIVSTLAWTVFQIRAATRSRQPLYDLDSDD